MSKTEVNLNFSLKPDIEYSLDFGLKLKLKFSLSRMMKSPIVVYSLP